MTSEIVELLWKKVEEAEADFHKVMNDVLKKEISFKDNSDKNFNDMKLLGIVDRIQDARNHMIRCTNLWREFKWQEEEKKNE
jgi:hypothetical protein